jgi:transcriptional regulator with XRE-family HTH domain
MWKRQVGERIHQLRRGRNLTRAEFGALIGKSEQYIGRLERGTLVISSDIVVRICEETGVSADYVLRGTIDPLATVASLHGLSQEQIHVTLEIAEGIIRFLRTAGGNNALLQEAMRRSQQLGYDAME